MSDTSGMFLAIALVVLLVTTPIASATSTEAPSLKATNSATTNPITTTTTSNLALSQDSVSARKSAYVILSGADIPGSDSKKKQLLSSVNRTFDAYLDANRVSASVFATDRKVAAKTQNHAPRVAKKLAIADAKLAHTAVEDAERVLSTLQSRNVTLDSGAVHDDIKAARKALQKGDAARARDSVSTFTQYGKAWMSAQRALDRMDADVSPTVNITRRVDPLRNGSSTYTVVGTVSDVRTHDVENATVTLNGATAPLHIVGNTTPGGHAAFQANVTVPDGPATITASVTDPGVSYAERATSDTGKNASESPRRNSKKKKKSTGKADEAQKDSDSNSHQSVSASRQTSSDTLLLDEDLLPDKYERTVTGTAPLDSDSNSNVTDTDEADNVVLDGAEDFDNDSVRTFIEHHYGTNPHDRDTDDDRLIDWFELHYDNLDPQATDTDGDGTPDAVEDFDDEGLSNEREQTHRTKPHDSDTDDDNLTDAYEVDITETLPRRTDSNSNRTNVDEGGNDITDGKEDFDNDTLISSFEADLGTDPFDTDTDDDRLNDQFEHRYETIDPTVLDTNDDGTADDREDPDNDTLVNYAEQRLGTHPLQADTDVDNLTDPYEVQTTGTDPTVADSDSNRTDDNESENGIADGREDFDSDALETALEAQLSTDPFDSDTDDDELVDRYEHVWRGIDPLVTDTDSDGILDATEDPDNDTLDHLREQTVGTNPFEMDTDADNLTDPYEIRTVETNPVVPDSDSNRTQPDEARNDVVDGSEDFDGDSLLTAAEYQLETAPFDPDSDNDELRDGFEVHEATTDPLANDTDSDGTPDAAEDFDGDTLSNLAEQRYGSNPHDPDTDDDSLTDAFEVQEAATDPANPDSDSTRTEANEADDGMTDAESDFDGDGLSNEREQALETDPVAADTDRDALGDGKEVTVVQTDPLIRNSDSGVTDIDESRNDTPDGEEDFDGDGLETALELDISIDPFADDTDGDRLDDPFEITYPAVNATVTDTDGDGVLDGEEDLDADALDNVDELQHGTMPIQNDTDSDSLLDGREIELGTNPLVADTDSDGLPDKQETSLGTDATVNDTDSDGLDDALEVEVSTVDPAIADSDGDGVNDGSDDIDTDGLANQQEVAVGTNLTVNDTDREGLLDGREVELNTDPLTADTDGDGLTDAEELKLGADPLLIDTDSDGTTDANETYTTKKTNEASGAELTVTGEGNAASRVTVEHEANYHNGTDASAGPTVRVAPDRTTTASKQTNETEIGRTNVSLPVKSTASADNVSVFVWNGSRQQAWHAVKTKVDAKNGTATATVEPGNYVTVLNRTAWQNAISVERKEPRTIKTNASLSCTGTCEANSTGVIVGEGTSNTTSISGFSLDNQTADDGNRTTNQTKDYQKDFVIACLVGPDGDCDEDEDGTLNGGDECPKDAGYAGDGCPDSDGDGHHDGEDNCPNEAGDGSSGCPVKDSDGDGINDDPDDCPNTWGSKTNGCPIEDTDNDDVPDYRDDCPNTWGSKANGCVDRDYDDDGTKNDYDPCPRDRYDRCEAANPDPDSDGDGVDDSDDNCPNTSNLAQTNADGDADGDACDPDDDNDGVDDDPDNCPYTPNAAQVDRDGDNHEGDGDGAACDPDEQDYDEASWQLDVPDGTGNVYFQMQLGVDIAADSSANLTILGASGEAVRVPLSATNGLTRRKLDVGQFAGETVTVRISTTGDANVLAKGVRVYQDSDGDTLSNYRERQRWTIPYGYGDSFTLDPHSSDTDGDRLDDPQEVSLGPAVSNPASPLKVRYATSNPGEVDTDDDTLNDRRERQADTNAFLADTDYDYLRDGEEVTEVGTNPLKRDTDEDHLMDGTEARKVYVASRLPKSVKSNPLEADTDGDGLIDGSEIDDPVTGQYIPQNTYRVFSDPSKRDTDGDAIPDSTEAQMGTDAWTNDSDGDTLADPMDPNPTTPDEVQASTSDLEKAKAFLSGAALGEFGFPNDSPYYLAGWMTVSLAPGVDIVAGARDLVAAVKEGKSFDAALETVALIPVLGKVGDVSKAVDKAKTYAKAFPEKAGKAQRVLSEVVLRKMPDGMNARIYSALGADETVTRLRANGLSNTDLEKLVGKLPESESLSDVAWATKHGGRVIYLADDRLDHIIGRHSTGALKPERAADFFPTGEEIKGIDDRPRWFTPQRMNEEDIPELIGETIENPSQIKDGWNGDTIVFKKDVDKYGIKTMDVRVYPPDHDYPGRVATAWPDKGPAVYRFNGVVWGEKTL